MCGWPVQDDASSFPAENMAVRPLTAAEPAKMFTVWGGPGRGHGAALLAYTSFGLGIVVVDDQSSFGAS